MNDVTGQTTDMKLQCCETHTGSSLAANRSPRKKDDMKLLPTDIEK
jgi:hypothetical protein